jgi:iron-sulfur cluster repair protein YtfE (RIC family)
MAITLQTPIREILALRPRAVEVFESAMGMDFWHVLDLPLVEAARDLAVDPESLLRRLSALPGTAPGVDFERSPLYVLIDFLLHMHEEEDFLFPKALRTEASVAHPDLSSEAFRGSVGAYSNVMLHTPEHQLKELAGSLVRKAGAAKSDPSSALDRFRKLLEDFADRLVRHADLETGNLMPRALAMEKILHRRMSTDQE